MHEWSPIVESIVSLARNTLPREGVVALAETLLTEVNRQLTDVNRRVNRCSHCGEAYETTDTRSQFCSKSCKVMACRKRKFEQPAKSTDDSVNQHRLTELTVGGGGEFPEKAKPSKEIVETNGQHALFEKTVERATPKPRPPKKQFPPMPPDLACDARLVEAWQKWVKYRREMGKPVTPTGQAQAFAEFTRTGASAAVASINYTILKGWQGLQPAPFEMRGGGAAKPDVREKLNAAKRRDMDA